MTTGNPEEAAYYGTIGCVNLFDLGAIASKDEEAFRNSCTREGGRISEDTESSIACELTLEPLNTDKEYTAPPEGEISLEFSFHYYDPSWEVFASKTIEYCEIQPQIEPVADK